MVNDFTAAAHEVLRFLHERLGFGLWMVTRSEGDHWIVLAAEDHCYGVKDGKVLGCADALDTHLPQAPVVRSVTRTGPAAGAAPAGHEIKIGTYVSVPLRHADGSLSGSLCALDPSPRKENRIKDEQALVEMLADLLSRLLSTELKAAEEARRAEKAEADSMRDALTALYGRRGWNQLLRKEEERCYRYGHPAYVVFVDLDDLKLVNDTLGHAAGDELLIRTGRALLDVTRQSDVVARVGGDEFAVLAVECDEEAASSLVDKLRNKLHAENINASIGVAARRQEHGLEIALLEADADMYRQKKSRKSVGALVDAACGHTPTPMC